MVAEIGYAFGFLDNRRAVLLGNDHEYSETYFGSAAEYFDTEETDLLADTTDWWSRNLDPSLFGEWIGFIKFAIFFEQI